MSDFIAELRESQIPTVCEDLDTDEFVAELRPQRLNLKPDQPMEMDSLCCSGHSQFPSDEHVQGLVSTKQFSTEKTAKLIESSTLTLIQKLLYGHSIGSIVGQIKIELGDSPIIINFDHHGEHGKTILNNKKSSPFRDMTDEFNVRVRRGECDTLHSHKHLKTTMLKSLDLPPLEFVDQSYLAPRRGSDADSGYGGKMGDDLVDQMDAKTSRLITCEERSCSSVDSVLGSELRYQREPSCDHSTADPVSPASSSWEELDEESSALVIDESYDPETNYDTPSATSEKFVSHEKDSSQQIVPEPTGPTQQDKYAPDACHAESQQRSTSVPVDLSGDSEDPRGCLSPQAENLMVYSNIGHALMKNPLEMAKHAAQSLSRDFNLENFNQPAEDMDAQVPEMCIYPDEEEQVLDLSIKKPDNVASEERPRSNAYLTTALSNRSGQNVSRDGYGQPSLDSAFSSVFSSNNQPSRDMMHLQSYDGFSRGLVSVKIEAGCETQHSPQQLLSLTKNSLPRLAECKAEQVLDRSQIEKPTRILKENFSRLSHNHQAKHLARFSPYSREGLAQLTAKFLVSRKLAPENGVQQRVQLPQAVVKMEDEISREVSMSETALKNRVNAFVKNGGHQAQVEASSSNNNSSCSSGDANGKQPEARIGSRQGAGRRSSSGSYTCTHEGCGEEFACFQALESHSVNSHGRYLCGHCGKTFTARPNRDRHVRYHTGERPYKCDLCPMAFFRGDDLKYHRTTRHPAAEPFVCKRCNRNFTWNRDLERHQKHCRCKA